MGNSKHSCILAFKHSRIQAFWRFGVLAGNMGNSKHSKHSSIQAFKHSRIQAFWHFG
jgi:hypothetical protein